MALKTFSNILFSTVLLVVFAAIIVSGQQIGTPDDPYGRGVSSLAPNTTLKRTVGVIVGTDDILDFQLLFPNNPPMTVIIGDVDKKIQVLTAQGLPLDESRTTEKNIFIVRAPMTMPDRDAVSTPERPTRNATQGRESGSSVDFSKFWKEVAPAVSTIKFTLGCDGVDFKGVLTVRIHPYTFVATSMTYRAVTKKMEDLVAPKVNDGLNNNNNAGAEGAAPAEAKPDVPAVPGRLIKLSVINPIKRRHVDLASSQRLAAVTIVSLPTNGCRLFQHDGTLITVAGTNVTDEELSVYFAPPEDMTTMAVGSQCQFNFVAVTKKGYASNNGTITLQMNNPEKPKVYNTNVYFRPYDDVTRPVEFFVNSINPPSNFSYIISVGPKWGELYDVEESAFTPLTKPLAFKAGEPLSVYTGPENRLVLFYKLNKAGQEYFAKAKAAGAIKEKSAADRSAVTPAPVRIPRSANSTKADAARKKASKGIAPGNGILARPPALTAPSLVTVSPSAAAARSFDAAADAKKAKSKSISQSQASLAPGDVASITDTITYVVKDAFETSRSATVRINFVTAAGPTCGTSNFPHTFWDKPINNILLNYSVPSGRRVQRIVLTGTPKDPIGDLYYRRSFASDEEDMYEEDIPLDENERDDTEQTILRITKVLRQGETFGDRNRRLSYMVRPENRHRSGEDVYTFRAITDTAGSLSCTGTLRFTVIPHDQRENDRVVRNEIARLNSIDLMPFWGIANRSLLEKNNNDKKQIVKVKITKAPALGKVYSLKPSTPYQAGEMIRGHVGIMSYCGMNACEDYTDKELVQGSEAAAVQLWSEATLDTLDGALFYFYKSPYQDLVSVDYRSIADTFEYVFIDKEGRQSETQTVRIYFRKPRRRIVNIEYSAASVNRWENFNRQQETIIPLDVASAEYAVQILDPDPFRRHGERVPFRLFQHRIEGDRVVPSDRLSRSVRGGLQGNWVQHPNNSIVLIPTIESRVQVFKFRARLFLRAPEALKSGDITSDIANINTYEEVRVIARRAGNTVPVWDDTNIVKYSVFVDERIRLMLTATDAEDDLVSFIISQAPQYGTLESETLRFGVSTVKILKSGSRVTIPKGSSLRSELALLYSSRGSSQWVYPVRDLFIVHADDGGGTLSAPITVTIDIVGDRSERLSQPIEFVVRTGNITVYVVGLVIVLLLAVSFFLRRYYAAAPGGRRGYGGVPTTDTEMS